MSLTAVIALLQAALALLTLVIAHPEFDQPARDNAMHVASQAITIATQALTDPQTSTNQSTYNGNVSDLIHSQSCPHIDPPTCSTYGIATFDTNGCVTKYTCAPSPQTTATINTNTSTGVSCNSSCNVGGFMLAGCVNQSYPEGTIINDCVTTYPDGHTITNQTCLTSQHAVGLHQVCKNGQWVSGTQTTAVSCTLYGQTYSEGQSIAGICPPPPSGGACSGPMRCHNGQWVAQ